MDDDLDTGVAMKNIAELEKELDKLHKNIQDSKAMMKTLDDEELMKEKVRIYDLNEEALQLNLRIIGLRREKEDGERTEMMKKNCDAAKQNNVKHENTSEMFENYTSSGYIPGNVQRDKSVRYVDNSGCRLKAPKYRKGDDFCTFLLRFEQYIMLGNVKDNLDFRLSSLIEDDAMFKKVRNMRLSMGEKLDVSLLVQAVRRELYPATDARILRTTFHKMGQKSGESVEQYAQRVMDEAEKIYPDTTEREGAAITALISGISDLDIKRRLLASKDSESFVSMTRLAVQEEHISTALELPRDSQTTPEFYDTAPLFGLGREENEESGIVNCQKCGRRGHKAETCWSGVKCQLCDRMGHVARVCNFERTQSSTANQSGYTRNNQQRARSPVTCYNCGVVGHVQRLCNRPRGGGVQSSYRPPSSNQQRTSQRNTLNGSATGRNLDSFSRRRNF